MVVKRAPRGIPLYSTALEVVVYAHIGAVRCGAVFLAASFFFFEGLLGDGILGGDWALPACGAAAGIARDVVDAARWRGRTHIAFPILLMAGGDHDGEVTAPQMKVVPSLSPPLD